MTAGDSENYNQDPDVVIWLDEYNDHYNILFPIFGWMLCDKTEGGMTLTPWVVTGSYYKVNTFTWNQDIHFWEVSPG